MSIKAWTQAISTDWANPGNWSSAGVPGASSDVLISSGTPIASASIGTVNSITDLSELFFESAGANTVTTYLENTGYLFVDYYGGEGGTRLNIKGTLTNTGTLYIGNTTLSASDKVTAASLVNTGQIYLTGAASTQALLDVTAGAAGFGVSGALMGDVTLSGDSAIEFLSGQIATIAIGAALTLEGNSAFIEDSTALGSNSALKGLSNITGTLSMDGQVSLATTGALLIAGTLYLDLFGTGGSSLTTGGALNNGGNLYIGNASLSSSTKLVTTALSNTGTINMIGFGANQALLDVTGGSAGFGVTGVVTGYVLNLTGNAAIEFASGEISAIANGTALTLDGSNSFIEDSTALGSNSALTGLTTVAGYLYLDNQGVVTTTGSLANSGSIGVDFYGNTGSSSLKVTGKLTNMGSFYVGNASLSSADKATVGSLANTGTISVTGSTVNQALLDVTAGAGFGTGSTVTGTVTLAGDSAVDFTSGQITTVGLGGTLRLNGSKAFVEDSTALGSNSALHVSNILGTFTMDYGVSESSAALTDNGLLGVDAYVYGSGGSTLSAAGKLTNTGTLDIGNSGLSSSDSVTAASFVNSGSGIVNLTGNGTNFAALKVSGATTNNGSISIAADTETLAGAVGGSGSISLSNAHLVFDSSVSAGQTITETGADRLTLKQAQSFAATISGFGTGDTIDATNFLKTATTYNFVENIAGTGGTLTLHDGSLTANILMTGDYSKSSFSLAHDSGTGTLVKFV